METVLLIICPLDSGSLFARSQACADCVNLSAREDALTALGRDTRCFVSRTTPGLTRGKIRLPRATRSKPYAIEQAALVRPALIPRGGRSSNTRPGSMWAG